MRARSIYPVYHIRMQNKFIRAAAISAALSVLLSPLVLVHAQTTGASADASVQVNASSTRPGAPKLGPAIKKTLQNAASTTGASIKARVEAVQGLIGDHKEAMHERLMQNKEALQERAAEVKDKVKARFSEAAQKAVGNIVDKLNAAVERLTKVAAGAQAHIDTLQTAGADVSGSVELLAQANTDISSAQVKIDAVATALEAVASSDTPKTEMANVRTAVQAAAEAIRTARASLKAVLESIRTEGAGVKADSSAEASADATAE